LGLDPEEEETNENDGENVENEGEDQEEVDWNCNLRYT
jgi:hypothetical protein